MPTIAGLKRRLRGMPFQSLLLARLSRRRHAVVLGDSHALVFEGWSPPGWRFDVIWVGGATASGARNPNSATHALPIYRSRLARVRPFQDVLVMLGEVDCGYVIWRRLQDGDGGDVDLSLGETLARYAKFLEEVATTVSGQLLVMSVPLPTLPDDSSHWGDVARKRSDVQISQRDRTDLTLRFNAAVQALCEKRGYVFVDATAGQLDPATHLVADRFLRHGTGDHHLVCEPYRGLIEAALPARA